MLPSPPCSSHSEYSSVSSSPIVTDGSYEQHNFNQIEKNILDNYKLRRPLYSSCSTSHRLAKTKAHRLCLFMTKKLHWFCHTIFESVMFQDCIFTILSYEMTGDLAEIRLFCSCTILRHDVLGQETLLNLFLRNYLPYNLYDKVERLRSMHQYLRHILTNRIGDLELMAKSIRDGAINATIDHLKDIYSTNELQNAFNSRIAFCLNMHNEAVRALRFPPNTHMEKESEEKSRER
ncbi:hypothetical protein HID58_015622 [Brassica napus]|uniref:Uncharacterized protein n=1 Tax=Brassica napus TaxID=3708 RepID=A0ABQ8DKM1_BRANA|nr:hypothetical protein HID58_015622 [Brassica napus]